MCKLLEDEGHMMVMTCIDIFSKMVQLIPLRESDACTIADKFLRIEVNQHRLPECTMNDHDPHFCGHFWDELMSLLDITLTLSMALHPQSDGMAEVMNHTIE